MDKARVERLVADEIQAHLYATDYGTIADKEGNVWVPTVMVMLVPLDWGINDR